ncbi:DUF4294 domain-containing protein [Frigoriflavimonas asaccharolytica]|uniref:DUF4294 domain-containing protein n=1 Tax=Frigoriflavimonas asaccharolytica TaxID=2735899 RepID=A0A8J8K8Y5_9FLAO|nr:DUF4294 domain-containing protein [Frigoriflavimonas asaccharolytica]NRS93046.1 hypothetical protein [Frigoriflavimonas asaccharolytica]
MNFNKFYLVLLMFLGVFAFSQDPIIAQPLSSYESSDLKTDEFGNKYYYDAKQKAKIYDINGETVVVMDELIIANKPKFNNQLDRNYYYFLNKKLYRVYPLFLKALEQYRDIQEEVAALPREDQRKLIRQKQSALADEYQSQIMNLTTTEGKVFTKLLHRATGKTVFEIIKELRGNWSAFWWNVKGNIADVSIKEPYDPYNNRTDLFLESLLQSNWNAGYLQPYDGYENYKMKK